MPWNILRKKKLFLNSIVRVSQQLKRKLNIFVVVETCTFQSASNSCQHQIRKSIDTISISSKTLSIRIICGPCLVVCLFALYSTAVRSLFSTAAVRCTNSKAARCNSLLVLNSLINSFHSFDNLFITSDDPILLKMWTPALNIKIGMFQFVGRSESFNTAILFYILP